MRFDGKMNAKQRQEVLQRFSVPVKGESSRKGQSERMTADFLPDNGDSFSSDDDDFAETKGKGKGTRGKSVKRSKSFAGSLDIPKVMLISLKAGALGLNLTVANNVYLCVFYSSKLPDIHSELF